jgi:hypothetical protein
MSLIQAGQTVSISSAGFCQTTFLWGVQCGEGRRSTIKTRGKLSYLAPLGSEKISAHYFKQCFFSGGRAGITPQAESNTTPPIPKTEVTNILFYILNFASVIKFKM